MARIHVASVSLTACILLSAPLTFAADGAGADAQRLGQLETGVRAEEAVRAVKRLQNTYSQYLESGLWDDLGDLFTRDAVGQFRAESVRGRDNLRKRFMQDAGRTASGLAAGQLNVHLALQPIVTVSADGKTVRAAWHELAMLGKFGGTASWSGGVYENEYAMEKGVWKISRLNFYQQYSGWYDDWGHKAPARWDIPYHFEAAHVGVTIPHGLLESAQPASARVNVASLAQRVKRLNDETEVQNLQNSFGYYLDRKMWDDVADLFADDSSLELGQRGVYIGKPHIRRALEVFYGANPLRHGELFDHINLATVVSVSTDGHSASARTTQLSMIGLNGEYARWEEGTYENEFVNEVGRWKLKALHYYPRLNTDYDLGWARDAKPAPVVSNELPPDKPPTQAFESYPKLQYVGFHYANPATGRQVRYPAGAAVVRVPVVVSSLGGGSSGRSQSHDSEEGASLADVARDLDRAIAFDAVENLNSSYGYYIDESAWDDMADTYAHDGSKEITGAGVYVGPDRIRKVLNMRGPVGGRNPKFFTIHQLTQPVIHISADGQRANGRFRLFQGGGNADGSSASWIGGIYENTAEKENGEWKFGRQELYHIFNASYRNGWARVGSVTKLKSETPQPENPRDSRGGGITQGLGGAFSPGKFVTEFPPDRPIVVRQYAFPDIVEPPFHYKNAVTDRVPTPLSP